MTMEPGQAGGSPSTMALPTRISGETGTEANLARDSLVFFEPNIRRTPVTPFAT